MGNIPRWYFGPLECNKWGGYRLDTKKSRRQIFQRITGNCLFRGEPKCATPLTVDLTSGNSDVNRFMVTIRDRKSFEWHWKNSINCLDDWKSRWFCFAFRHFGTHFAESFYMSKSSWIIDQTQSRGKLRCSDID